MPTSNADTTSSPPTHDTGKTIEPTATSDPASSALAQKWPRLFETFLRLSIRTDRPKVKGGIGQGGRIGWWEEPWSGHGSGERGD